MLEYEKQFHQKHNKKEVIKASCNIVMCFSPVKFSNVNCDQFIKFKNFIA